jgi:hypothetical protein
MKYTIYDNKIYIAENENTLSRYYNTEISELPEDYETGKYIIGEEEREIDVPDPVEEGEEQAYHKETITVKVLVLNPDWEEEQAQKRKEMLSQMSLTKREVFLALYKDKGITPEQLKAQITEPEALIEFEYANDYFRGNPLIDLIGQSLGYTSEALDYLFEHKELPKEA